MGCLSCLSYLLAVYQPFGPVPRRVHLRLPCANLLRVSRIRLRVNRSTSILSVRFSILLVDAAPRARMNSTSAAAIQRIALLPQVLSESQQWRSAYSSQISNQLKAKRKTFHPGRLPFSCIAVSWVCWVDRSRSAHRRRPRVTNAWTALRLALSVGHLPASCPTHHLYRTLRAMSNDERYRLPPRTFFLPSTSPTLPKARRRRKCGRRKSRGKLALHRCQSRPTTRRRTTETLPDILVLSSRLRTWGATNHAHPNHRQDLAQRRAHPVG